MPESSDNSHAATTKSLMIDQSALMRIKNLELRAKAVMEGFMSGLHRSPFHGFSVEFSEYREYSPGDDLRYLDWRLYARSDRYYIKRFEDETNLRCHLLVDLSRSMDFGSGEITKADYVRTIAATISYFLITQRDAVGLSIFDEEIRHVIPPRYRSGQLHRLLSALESSSGGAHTDLAAPLEQLALTVSKRGMVVLLTDFLTPIEAIDRPLRQLRMHGHDVILMRVLDRAESTFEFDDPTMFLDLENNRQLYVDPNAVRETYLQRFNEHSDRLADLAGAVGADLITLHTDDAVDVFLHEFLTTRQGKGRQVQRRGQMRSGGVQ
jgi:uncharacterized protein (DUF58 family)